MRKRLLVLFLILSLAVAALSLSFRGESFRAFGGDESVYLQFTASLLKRGLSGYPALFQGYLSDRAMWVLPSPLRPGFIIAAYVWTLIFGNNFAALAFLSLCAYALFLCASFYFSRKWLERGEAFLFTFLLAFSPLLLAMGRRALAESLLNLFSALALWLFFWLAQQRSFLRYALFIGVYGCAILIKETAFLLSVIFAAYLCARKIYFKKEVSARDFLAISLLPFTLVAAVYWALGGWPYVFPTLKVILNSPAANPYAVLYGGGPWFRYLLDWMLLSPVTTLLGIGYIFSLAIRREKDELSGYWLLVLVLGLALLSLFTKNARYLIFLETPIRLFAFFMLRDACRGLFKRHSSPALFLAVAFICVYDYSSFTGLFLGCGIYDPVSLNLLRARSIIP
jgi:4-amino-4-deoxy-L-arabinose transferase-like glycosyltransferase